MTTKPMTKIFLVDDDELYLKLLSIELAQNALFQIVCFTTGELCLAAIDQLPDVIILDYHLNGIDKNAMNGIKTLQQIKEKKKDFSVIILSAQDKIEVAVDCMHHGAFDYVVKNETAYLRLHKAIKSILELKKMKTALNWYMDRM
jgi:DNA-binding NtrC family response regulator